MSVFEFLSERWLSTRDTPATTDVGGARLIRTSALPIPRTNSKRDIKRLVPSYMVNFEKLKYDLEWADIPAKHATEMLRLASLIRHPASIGSALIEEGSSDRRHFLQYGNNRNAQPAFIHAVEAASWFDYNQEDVRSFVDTSLWLGEEGFVAHFDPSVLRFDIDQEELYERLTDAGEPITRHELIILSNFVTSRSDPSEVAVAMAHNLPYSTIKNALAIDLRDVRKSVPKGDYTALLWGAAAITFFSQDGGSRNNRGDIVFDLAARVDYQEFLRFANTDGGAAILNSDMAADLVIASIKNEIDFDFLDVMDGTEKLPV